jgi:hypothetical protein
VKTVVGMTRVGEFTTGRDIDTGLVEKQQAWPLACALHAANACGSAGRPAPAGAAAQEGCAAPSPHKRVHWGVH